MIEGVKSLNELVYEAMALASMCWSETPKGVFDDVKAKQIAELLIRNLKAREVFLGLTISDQIDKSVIKK